MRSILVVSDLTPGSDGALSTAARLAARTGAALHLVHPMEIVGMPLWEAVQTDVGRRIRDAETALAEQVRRAVPDGCALASRALHFQGLRDSVLLRVRETGADLVVFGAEEDVAGGARRARSLESLAGAAAVPCLLVRSPLHPPPLRVLLPLSAAEVGRGVLADACDWLTSLDPPVPSELQVLHVASGPRQWRDLAARLDDEVRRAGEQRRWFATLRIGRGIRWSVAADVEILRVAEETSPDLVVLGPGCGVADSPVDPQDARAVLVRRLPCSVLVLPGALRPDGEDAEPASGMSPVDAGPLAGEEPESELAVAAD